MSNLFQEFINLSEKYGRDSALIQGAGGNTSLKENGVLWVKASGCWLSDAIKNDIFVPINNQEAVEYVKMKSDLRRIAHLFRKKGISPPPDTYQSRIFVIRTPGRFPQSVTFRSDCDVVEFVSDCSNVV